MQPDALAAALLTLCQGGEGIPFNVRITPSDEVLALRARVEELESEVKFWKEKLQHSEYKRGSERQITERLMALLEDHDIRIPRDVFKSR